MASGKNKSAEIKKFIEGPVTNLLPVSILKFHENITVIIDKEAASDLNDEVLQILINKN
jgi:glucosamine-6-phosphate deaminase